MDDYKFLFKVVLIGNAGVGKTCLVRRFTQGLFPPGQGATIGVDFMIKTVEINGEKIKLQVSKNRLKKLISSQVRTQINLKSLPKNLKYFVKKSEPPN
jgi:Ras-related protein Rab-1A